MWERVGSVFLKGVVFTICEAIFISEKYSYDRKLSVNGIHMTRGCSTWLSVITLFVYSDCFSLKAYRFDRDF